MGGGRAQAKSEGNMMVEAKGRGNKGGEFVGGVKGRRDKRCDRERKQTEKTALFHTDCTYFHFLYDLFILKTLQLETSHGYFLD